ncbi:hypothetical protein [Permianibacter aggregans]|uniref:hypothetical protein n=1 Tax=Permianibacter aggregans TaxID=1510150 RepID=UPI001060C95E|nr:hypothetical protein [Permianibacter aggregans]QGX39863.1 hypothetical protein E2H98_09415 [Permianibacter aggregans]
MDKAYCAAPDMLVAKFYDSNHPGWRFLLMIVRQFRPAWAQYQQFGAIELANQLQGHSRSRD